MEIFLWRNKQIIIILYKKKADLYVFYYYHSQRSYGRKKGSSFNGPKSLTAKRKEDFEDHQILQYCLTLENDDDGMFLAQ